MLATIDYTKVEAGNRLPEKEFTVKLVDEVMYCGAGMDFVGVHWNLRVANSVGLPHVVAHGPMTVAKALTVIHDWAGDPTAVISYDARFEAPVFVPDDGRGASYRVGGVVQEKLADNRVVVLLTVTSEDSRVLARVHCVTQLPHVGAD